MQFGVSKHNKIFQRQQIAFLLQLCTRITWKMDLFSASQTCVIFSGILLHAGREWDFGSSYRRINTDPTKSKRKGKWEVCKHAKRQKAKKALDYVSCFPLCAPAACCCFTTKQSFFICLYSSPIHDWNYCHLKYLLFSAK